MKYVVVFSVSALAMLSVFSGCKEEATTPPLSGNITGFVSLIDSNGIRMKDLSGANVSIDGTSFSSISDSNGKWNIDGVSAGIYSLTYSKPGFGVYKAMNQGFVGGGTLFLNTVTLAKPPNFVVSIDSAKTLTDTNSIYVAGLAHGCRGPGFSRVLIAIGTTPDVSAADPNKYVYSTSTIVWSNELFIGTHLYRPDLNYAGLVSGSKVYVVLYPLSTSTGIAYTSYLDENTGKFVYTSLGAPSAIVHAIVP